MSKSALDIVDIIKCANHARAALRRGDAANAQRWLALVESAATAAETLRLTLLRHRRTPPPCGPAAAKRDLSREGGAGQGWG